MERKLKCIVIDDEPLARGLIESYVEKTPVLTLDGSYESAAEAFRHVSGGCVDVVFLDINMPLLNGIEFAEVIPKSTRIIYVTAYDKYAIDGFCVNALDYLLKPVSYAEFMRAVGKALEWFDMARSMYPGTAASDRSSSSDMLTVKADYRLIQMRLDTIRYIEVRRDNVIFYRTEGDPVKSGMSMRELEELLPSEIFMRVHRSFIVNLRHVEVVERGRIVFGKTYIPVSDTRRDDFLARLGHS